MVHKPRESNLCLIEDYLAYSEPINQDINPEAILAQTCGVSVYVGRNYNINDRTINIPRELEQFEHISIKTITCDLVTGLRRKRVVVAIDSGANNTNIDERLAREVGVPVIKSGLQREMHMVTRAERLVSSLVIFQLCPLGSEYGPNFTIGAFTVPDLIEGTPVPDWKYASEVYPYLKAAEPRTPLPDDRVSILLGTDYSHLMVGTETIRGEMGQPIAEKTALGWAFQGRTGKTGYRERIGALIESHRSLSGYHDSSDVASIEDLETFLGSEHSWSLEDEQAGTKDVDGLSLIHI